MHLLKTNSILIQFATIKIQKQKLIKNKKPVSKQDTYPNPRESDFLHEAATKVIRFVFIIIDLNNKENKKHICKIGKVCGRK